MTVASKLSLFLAELKRRKVTRVAVVYCAVAWVAVEVADTVFPNLLLPAWSVTFVVVLALLGFPVAMVLAWVFDITPEGILRTPDPTSETDGEDWQPVPRSFKILGAIAIPVAVGVAIWVTQNLSQSMVHSLDPTRVVVYPLETPGGDHPEAGEDAATWIGYVLEASGRVRWLDGWYALNPVQQAGLGSLEPASARSGATTQGAAFFVRGRISLFSDSARVLLELHDVRGDSILARGVAMGPTMPGWPKVLGEEAGRQLIVGLPSPESRQETPLPSDTLEAVTSFLEGERSYRRSQFVDASRHYQEALEADSTFALAALRSVEAALWQHDLAQAETLLAILRERSALLSPRHAQLAAGLRHYVEGNADEAVRSLEQALMLSPEWWEARARLGEVYTHLLPRSPSPDSLEEAAFLEVYRQDPGLTPVLYHLLEIAARKGEILQAEEYLRQFRSANPDSSLLRTAELKVLCSRGGPGLVDWRQAALSDPGMVWLVGQSLAKGAYQVDCARAAWNALIVHDTLSGTTMSAYRWGALMALQSLLLAEGRAEEVGELWASYPEVSSSAGLVLVLDALSTPALEPEAEEAIEGIREAIQGGTRSPYRPWLAGLWANRKGNTAEARLMVQYLTEQGEESNDPLSHLLAQSLNARIFLAEGDTTGALASLRGLVPIKLPGNASAPWESLGGDWILLSELFLARGQYAEAIATAAHLESSARPPFDLLYLPESLAIRMRAADALGDETLAERCRSRLLALGRLDLLAGAGG